MSVKDEGAFSILNRFVNGFFPSRWVTREGDDVIDEDGEHTFHARPINTKALIKCHTYVQVVAILGLCLCDSIAFCFFNLFWVCPSNEADSSALFLFLQVTWPSVANVF